MRLLIKQPRRRHGSVLVYAFLMVFGMLAITAMVTDVGYAILTRRQMLVAVDSAATEGLRGRDDERVPEQLRDRVRRFKASERVSQVFDDDLIYDLDPNRPSLAHDRFQFGAGPVVELSGGIALQGTSFRAAQKLTVGSSPVYDPVLRLNMPNSVAGDMVSGRYLQSADFAGGTASFPTFGVIRHVERRDYTRDDFIPDPPPGAPGAGVAIAELPPASSAFLVRMRRTNEVFPPTSDESSNGPSLPYLFGRGTLLNPEAKARGISVRATAIAEARRAMSVGLPYDGVTPPLTGVTSFVLERSFWDGLSSAEVVADGSLISTFERVTNDKGEVVGIRLTGTVGKFTGPLTSVGQPLPGTLPSSGSLNGYVPIYQALPITERVIGFGRGELVYGGTLFGYQLATVSKVTITNNGNVIRSILAPENASAVLTHPLNLLDAAELASLLAAYESFQDPLLAPALVR